MSQTDIMAFNQNVLSVLTLFQKALEKEPEAGEKAVQPSDFRAIPATLRGVAEDLMVSASVDEAMQLLKRDPIAALTVVNVARNLNPQTLRKVIQRAHAKAPADISTLPCLPLAMFLIELCDSLALLESD